MEDKRKSGMKRAGIIVLIAVMLVILIALLFAFRGKRSSTAPEESPKPVIEEAGSVAPAASIEPEASSTPETDEKTERDPEPVETDSNDSSESEQESKQEESPAEEGHEHLWRPIYTTVHHEEKSHIETVTVRAAWDEEVYGSEAAVCCSCGFFTSDANAMLEHIREAHDGNAGYSMQPVLTEVIHHDAVTEPRVVVDSPAWDEEVISHYICSCGEVRK